MDQTPQPTGFSQPPVQPQVVPEPIAAPRRESRGSSFGCCCSFLLIGLIGSLALNAVLVVVVGLTGLAESDERGPRAGEILLPQPPRRRQGGHPLDRGHDPQRRRVLQASDRPRPERHRGGQPEGACGPRRFARRHDHRQRLHVPLPPQTGRRTPIFPVVVSMGGIAASGGYYVSMCVGDKPDTIFAEPTTWTGSIGVIIPHLQCGRSHGEMGNPGG